MELVVHGTNPISNNSGHHALCVSFCVLFKIGTFNNDLLSIDYSEESFNNGSISESLYTINTGLGLVTNNGFNCFTDGQFSARQ